MICFYRYDDEHAYFIYQAFATYGRRRKNTMGIGEGLLIFIQGTL